MLHSILPGWPVVTASLLTAVFPGFARAEINGAESLDWIVADSTVIVRGRIAKVTTKRESQVTTERATMKSLLTDPGFYTSAESDKPREKVFPVRRDAYQILLDWNVKVDRPVIEQSFRPTRVPFPRR